MKSIKLTTCSEGEFTCNDGQCIDMEQRFFKINGAAIIFPFKNTFILLPLSCDQTSNCIDESDEDNCKLLSMKVRIKLLLFYLYFSSCQDNYNKKIAPFSFDKVLKAVIPVKINVSISVIDILRIKEVDHIYVLKFRLVLEWWTQ